MKHQTNATMHCCRDRPQNSVRSVFWQSISRRGLDCDDIAVEGIFRVTDTKLDLYSYWSIRQPALNGCIGGDTNKSARDALPRGMYGE